MAAKNWSVMVFEGTPEELAKFLFRRREEFWRYNTRTEGVYAWSGKGIPMTLQAALGLSLATFIQKPKPRLVHSKD